MGEAKRKRSATQKLISDFPHCYMCGGARASTTREHMPPKALFDGSHRPDKLVMPACDECNGGTSTADLVASVVSRWSYSSIERNNQDHRRLAARLRKQAPEIISEWTAPLNRLKARRHLETQGVAIPSDARFITIGPSTIRQLNLFSHKLVLGLFFEHFKKPLPIAGRMSAYWRTKEDFAGQVPKELLDMMNRYGTLEQGKWNAREIFEYRYEINENDGLFACLARLRAGLYVVGFLVTNASALDEDDASWISPSELLGKLDDPAFEMRP